MNVPTKLTEQIRPGSRRRRLLIAPAAVVAVVGLLLANAVAVGQQSAEATGDSTLPLDGGNIYVRQDGPRDAPAVVLIHGLAGSTRWLGFADSAASQVPSRDPDRPTRARPVSQTGRPRL